MEIDEINGQIVSYAGGLCFNIVPRCMGGFSTVHRAISLHVFQNRCAKMGVFKVTGTVVIMFYSLLMQTDHFGFL